MTRRMLAGLALIGAALGFALALSPDSPAQEKPAALIQIGMVKSFFHDVPNALIAAVIQPFGDVMKEGMGLNGNLSIRPETFQLVHELDTNKMQLGVFHGHEFAWAQKKNPKLMPLVVVVNDHNDVSAFIIVHKNSPAKTVADLRGKTIDVPKMTKEHCRIYLEKECTDNAQPDLKRFFAAIKKSDPYDALDDVAREKVDAVVVDTITLEFYKAIKNAVYHKNLRILKQSVPFPAPVMAYKQGSLDQATLKNLRDGLLTAHKNPVGLGMMQLWQIKAFEAVPSNYAESLARVLKEYPMPEAPTKVSMK